MVHVSESRRRTRLLVGTAQRKDVMKRFALSLAALVLVSFAASATAAEVEFGSYWHDGRAELDGYSLRISRYGQPRSGIGVMIYVTEPFSESKRVKVDDPSKNPADTFDALKLNIVRDFQTGIYDYNTMVGVVKRSDPLKKEEQTSSPYHKGNPAASTC